METTAAHAVYAEPDEVYRPPILSSLDSLDAQLNDLAMFVGEIHERLALVLRPPEVEEPGVELASVHRSRADLAITLDSMRAKVGSLADQLRSTIGRLDL